MARNSAGRPFELSSCARTTDGVLRALARIRTTEELATLMDAVSRELGYRHFAMIHHDDLRSDLSNRVKILKYPQSIVERIIDHGTWRRDPIIRACIFTPCAFRWSDVPSLIDIDQSDRRCLEDGAAAGLDDGITVPFHLLGECMGSCTFAGTRSFTRSKNALGLAQMVGVFAFQTARRIVQRSAAIRAPGPRLHPRPRDCVVLAGRGLTNKQIARALSLTPRTVDGYLTEARQLFNAHNRTELVISALFAGEIGAHEIRPRQPE
jgi:LuxR family quorum-sensing system transcriptional regulator CciR